MCFCIYIYMKNTIVISDIHLASDICQANLLCSFLEEIHGNSNIERLIINGDLFDNDNLGRLRKNHWHVLSLIRKMSDKKEIVYIRGNHDLPTDFMSYLLGVNAVNEYSLKSGDKLILFLHGHIFDKFLTNHPFLTWLGDSIYNFLQRVDKTHYWARAAKYSSKQYLRCAEVIKHESVKYAHKNGHNLVCVGHSHYAAEEPPYYNSGCWTELPSTYLSINNGQVKLNKFTNSIV
jgi:UDP-2,3-diacylglucosamine pyrophosphatase LpxH